MSGIKEVTSGRRKLLCVVEEYVIGVFKRLSS